MKANELRIGNWFYGDCTNGENHKITPEEILDLHQDPLDDYYQPIQLTEEWLLKFGFIDKSLNFDDYRCSMYWDGNYMHISDNRDTNYSVMAQCNYVHQLQNLYFALTGEELTVTN